MGGSLKGGQAWGTASFPWASPSVVLYRNPYLLGTVVDADMTLYGHFATTLRVNRYPNLTGEVAVVWAGGVTCPVSHC